MFKLQGGLFQSDHSDENDVQTISHKCNVLPLDQYMNKYGPDPSKYETVYDNNDTFYLAGNYKPTSFKLKLENHIPIVPSSTSTTESSGTPSSSTSSSSPLDEDFK